MEKHLDIHQEGVKATWTNVQGSWYEIHLPYITDTVSAIQLEKNMASTGIEPATFALLARRSNQLS